MAGSFQDDLDAIGRIPAVPTILDVVCRTTGMGFAAVARFTETRWIACSVHDDITFGLAPGGELKVETTRPATMGSRSGSPTPATRFRTSLQGLGLGLYIVSEIAAAHGGTLAVSSTEAETRFTFRLPLA